MASINHSMTYVYIKGTHNSRNFKLLLEETRMNKIAI